MACPLNKILDTPPHNLTMTLTKRLKEKCSKKMSIFMTSYIFFIHHTSLIFTIMQIKPRLLIPIQTIMQIRPDPWPPKATPDPYEYSWILSIDYVIPIVYKTITMTVTFDLWPHRQKGLT